MSLPLACALVTSCSETEKRNIIVIAMKPYCHCDENVSIEVGVVVVIIIIIIIVIISSSSSVIITTSCLHP